MEEVLKIAAAFAAMTALSFVGAPRLWLSGLAGMVFSPAVAFAVSIASTLLGNYGLFAACRGRQAERLVDWLSRRRSFSLIAFPKVNIGLSGVILMRQMPGPCALITLFLARTDVRAWEFAVGSLIGFAPTTLLTVLVTGTAARNLPAGLAGWATLALALVAGAVWLVRNRAVFGRARKEATPGSQAWP